MNRIFEILKNTDTDIEFDDKCSLQSALELEDH